MYLLLLLYHHHSLIIIIIIIIMISCDLPEWKLYRQYSALQINNKVIFTSKSQKAKTTGKNDSNNNRFSFSL